MLDVESVSLEEVGFRDEDSILAEMRSRDGTWPEEISSLSTGRGVSREQPAVPGVTGLNNLGNTCYMNAALQVVSSTRILAPIKLRWTIGKYQACFSSFQQQDS